MCGRRRLQCRRRNRRNRFVHHSGAGFIQRDAETFQCLPGLAVQRDAILLVFGLSSRECRAGDREIVLRSQRLEIRTCTKLLFLLFDVEGLLRQIARLARRFDARLALLQRIRGVTHLESAGFSLCCTTFNSAWRNSNSERNWSARACRLRSGICTCISAR